MTRFITRLIEIVNKCIKCDMGEWRLGWFYIYSKDAFISFIEPYKFRTFKRQIRYHNFQSVFLQYIMFRHPLFEQSTYRDADPEDFKSKVHIYSYKDSQSIPYINPCATSYITLCAQAYTKLQMTDNDIGMFVEDAFAEDTIDKKIIDKKVDTS